MKEEHFDLTNGSIGKGIIYFAIPIMISNILQQLYNAIDSAVVGTFAGKESLAAVGSTGALITLLVGFFLGISTGAGVIFAQYYGAKDEVNIKKVLNTSIILGMICGIALTCIGIVLSPLMLELMHCPEDVIGLATAYLRIYFIGVTPMLVYNMGAGIIRAGGDSKTPLYYLLYSGILNLFLDILFVAVLKMGVSGAALATSIAQAFSAALVLGYLMKIKKSYKLEIKKISFDCQTAVKILKLGVPCGLQSSMFSVSNMIVQTRINDFGAAAMAGCAAYEKIDGFLYMPMSALGLSLSTFVGQNIGAKKYERIKRGVKISMISAVVITIFGSVMVLASGRHLLSIFTNDESVKSYGILMMLTIAPFTFTHCFTEVLGGCIRGAGSAISVFVLTAVNICVLRIIWLLILFPDSDNFITVCACYPVSWIICSICFVIYYNKGKWMKEYETEDVKKTIVSKDAC